MNHYTHALAELKSQPAHLLKEVGDQWQTPPALFWGINAVFGPFVLDLFTDGENSKCPKFYTADNNALVQDWAADLAGGKAFGNPPYSRSSYDDDKTPITGMRNIIAKVMAERDKGAKIVLLLKSATSEVWWPEEADHIAFVRGRISFDLPAWFLPATKKDQASSAGFAVTICVFDKEWRGQPMQYIERDTLVAQGNALMDMIEQRASELAQQYASATIESRPDDAEPGEPSSNPCQLPEPAELSGNSGELPDPELSADGVQLEDHIADAGEMVEPDGTDIDGGTKAPELITLEFTSEQLEEQIESGKLPFSSNHLMLMFQLKLMFGAQPTYTSKQVKAAVLAYDEPQMVSKTEKEPASKPEPEVQPEPASVEPPAKVARKSQDPHDLYEVLGIPEPLRKMLEKFDDWSLRGDNVWIKGKEHKEAPRIQIECDGNFKKGYWYRPSLIAFVNAEQIGTFTHWDDAVAAIDAKQNEAQTPKGEDHPFFSGCYAGHPTYTQTVPDKVARVKTFTLEQCEAALKLPHLQSTVVAAVEARIRKLQKEQAA